MFKKSYHNQKRTMRTDQVLIRPIVTEKTLEDPTKLVFQVHSNARKADIMAAFQTFYGFTPLDVSVRNMPEKYRLVRGVKTLRKKAYKKVAVKIPAGKVVDYNVFV